MLSTDAEDGDGAGGGGGGGSPTDPWDSHVGSLISHQYFKERVLPMLETMERDAPKLQRKYLCVMLFNMIATSLATVLGATGQTIWIPIAVSASTVFTSILEHYKYKIRLNSTTQTMGELRALVSEWEAMGEISKRMIDARTRLVQVTEGVELSHAEAWAGPAGGLRAVAADDRGGSAADQPVPCKEGA